MDAGVTGNIKIIGTNPANAQQKPAPASSLQNSGVICCMAKSVRVFGVFLGGRR